MALGSREARPKGRFGFFGFPTCFGALQEWLPVPVATCSTRNIAVNDRLTWLWKSVDLLLPGVYLVSANASFNKAQARGMVRESLRIRELQPHLQLFPYLWSEFFRPGNIAKFPAPYPSCKLQNGQWVMPCTVDRHNMRAMVEVPAKLGVDGLVIWGSIDDVSGGGWTGPATRFAALCANMSETIMKTLGPILREAIATRRSCDATRCAGSGRCVDINATDGTAVQSCLPGHTRTAAKTDDSPCRPDNSGKCFAGARSFCRR